jgi:outer membrane protein insertion porin family
MRSVSGCAFRSDSGTALPRRGRRLALALGIGLAALGAALVADLAQAAGKGVDPSLQKRREAKIRRLGPLVEAVHLAGNEAFDRDELARYMSTRESGFFSISHYERRLLDADLANLERFYESQGFLDARVVVEDIRLLEDGLAVEILIGVYEGPRWFVSAVTYEGNDAFQDDELGRMTTLGQGTPYLPDKLEADRRSILDAYARDSYLDAKVSQTVNRDDVGQRVAIGYQIVEREQAIIDTIAVTGDDKTREFVIRRELVLSTGELFNFKKIGESQARLYRTGLFNSVWIEPAPEDTGKVAKRLDVRVRERPSGVLDFKAGYAAIDGVEVGAEFVNRSVQGQAIELGLSGKYGERVREARASVGDPWFMGVRIAIDAFGTYAWKDEESYVAETAGAGFVLTKRFGNAVALDGGYGFERTVVLEGVADREGEGTNYTSDLTAAVTYDTRSDILDARRGMLAHVETRFASSKLGGTNDFSLYEVSWRGFKDIRHGRTVALSARVGWIKPQGDGRVPVNERYFAGGEGSVRGFPRNSLSPLGEDGEPSGGRALVELRAEVRFPVYKRLGAAAFVDAGQAFEDFGAITRTGLAVGAGGGLRFRTDFGVLRLDVATPISESGSPQYYFGVGQAF